MKSLKREQNFPSILYFEVFPYGVTWGLWCYMGSYRPNVSFLRCKKPVQLILVVAETESAIAECIRTLRVDGEGHLTPCT